MLELNTDRIFMGIAALVLGGMFLMGMIELFPDAIGVWGFNTADSITSMSVSVGSDIPIQNNDFKSYSDNWLSEGGRVVYDGRTAYVPENTVLYMNIDLPEYSEVRVTFRGRGIGTVRVQLEDSNQVSSFNDMTLYSNMYSYNTTLERNTKGQARIMFKVPRGSEFILDEVWLTYLGNTND